MKIAIDKLRESEIGRRIIELIGDEELYKYDPDSLNSLHIDAVIKHSREQKEKLKVQYKKVDFFVRALHEAEVPLILQQSEVELQRRREIQQSERENAIERRGRLIRMEEDKLAFLQSIRGQRHEDFMAQKREFEKRLSAVRQQRLEQIRKDHVEKRKQEWRKQKEAEKEAKIRRQEEKRLADARAQARARDEKLNAQSQIQRQRDEEIQRRIEAEKNTSQTSSTTVRRPAPIDKDKTDRFVKIDNALV